MAKDRVGEYKELVCQSTQKVLRVQREKSK